MPTITWFDIPATDTGLAKTFYKTLFGWDASAHPVDFAEEFYLLSTGEQGVSGGEILKRREEGNGITVYIAVPSVEIWLEKVEKAGGQISTPKTAMPGMGYFAICRDTEGNRFGLWETDPEAGS
jgi:predicted enzyme related to lactoylglutathione lyase